MEFSQSLGEQLADLTDALEQPGTDVQTVLAVLIDDLTRAIPSFLGLSLTLENDGHPIRLGTLDPGAAAGAGASLGIPLPALLGVGPAELLVLFADHPGAFVDLAVDIRRALDLDGQVVVDAHLANGDRASYRYGLFGLDETVALNRAVGVLIALGRLPDDARAELHGIADHSGRTVLEVANGLLRDVGTSGTEEA